MSIHKVLRILQLRWLCVMEKMSKKRNLPVYFMIVRNVLIMRKKFIFVRSII